MITSTQATAGRRRRIALAAAGIATAVALTIGATSLPAEATTNAWGGYTNGKIPLTKLTKVSNGWLRPDAAKSYLTMSTAFKAKYGRSLVITEGYRTYATQRAIFLARYDGHKVKQVNSVQWQGLYYVKKSGVSVAAVPGTSVHGWALAADFNSGVQTPGSSQKKWADANGPKYGWYPVGNSFGEAWHFEFKGVPVTKPTPTPKPTATAKPTPTPKPSVPAKK
jgi:D-alanyl-D-alanine carboxypeptidase